jgi:hypothetical protein
MDLKKIARILEREKCSKHNENPTATPKKDNIELKCCCDKFQEELIKKMEKEMMKQVEDDIGKALDSL